jgi:hypothetical protein
MFLRRQVIAYDIEYDMLHDGACDDDLAAQPAVWSGRTEGVYLRLLSNVAPARQVQLRLREVSIMRFCHGSSAGHPHDKGAC